MRLEGPLVNGEGTFAKVKLSLLHVFNVLLQIKWEISTMKLIKYPNVVRLYEVSHMLTFFSLL
jgi:serine/threonine protein kinase